VVDPDLRGQQLGRELMLRGVAFCQDLFPMPIRISGQAYLQNFYESLDFATVSEPYLEDDIPHIEMLLPGP
jgi:ElaA protein